MSGADDFDHPEEETEQSLDAQIAELYDEETSLEDPDVMREAVLIDLDSDEVEAAIATDEANLDWYSLPDRGFERTRRAEEGESNLTGPRELTAARPRHRRLSGISWYYDAESYYAYLLLAATSGTIEDDDRASISAALILRGITPVLEGESHRAASDGFQYQRYIRVKNAKGGKPDLRDIKFALDGLIEAPVLAATRTRTRAEQNQDVRSGHVQSELEKLLVEGKKANLELQNKLRESLQEKRFLKASIRAGRRKLEEERDDFVARIKLLLEHLGQTKRNAAAAKETLLLLDRERARIEMDRDVASSLLDESLAKNTEFETAAEQTIALTEEELRKAEEQLEILRAEKEQLEDRLYEAQRLGSGRSDDSRVGFPEAELERILSSTIPSVSFLNGSLSVMQHEVQDYGPVLSLLSELDKSGHIARQKGVGGCPKWHEVHFSTGAARDGRLYFGPIGGDRKWRVLVAKKATQTQDIRYLRRVALKRSA